MGSWWTRKSIISTPGPSPSIGWRVAWSPIFSVSTIYESEFVQVLMCLILGEIGERKRFFMSSAIDFHNDTGVGDGPILRFRFVKTAGENTGSDIRANSVMKIVNGMPCKWGSASQNFCVGCGKILHWDDTTRRESCHSHGRVNDIMRFARYPGTPEYELFTVKICGDEAQYSSLEGELLYRLRW